MKISNRKKMAAVVLPFALFIAACGSSDSGSDSSKSDKTETTMSDKGTETTMADEGGNEMAAAPEGDGCAAVPETGDGSFEGMAQDPVATAASNNPALSTLVTAVGEADLVDTLNTGGPFTVFAPVNDAFAKEHVQLAGGVPVRWRATHDEADDSVDELRVSLSADLCCQVRGH